MFTFLVISDHIRKCYSRLPLELISSIARYRLRQEDLLLGESEFEAQAPIYVNFKLTVFHSITSPSATSRLFASCTNSLKNCLLETEVKMNIF